MSTAFTKGPWEVIFDEEGIWVTPPDHNEPVICDIVARLGSLEGETYTQQYQEDDEANAHLIASAPELYAALGELLKDYEESDFDIVGKDRLLIAKCKAVLAKASGKKEEEGK